MKRLKPAKEMPFRQFRSPYSANQALKLGIATLKGRGFSEQPFSGALADVITLRDRLRDEGWEWQSQVLSRWITRAMSKGDYL